MSGQRGPYKLELVRIRKWGETVHQAVDEKTAENILDTSAAYTHIDNPAIQFEADSLGGVDVYLPEWVVKDILEEECRTRSPA